MFLGVEVPFYCFPCSFYGHHPSVERVGAFLLLDEAGRPGSLSGHQWPQGVEKLWCSYSQLGMEGPVPTLPSLILVWWRVEVPVTAWQVWKSKVSPGGHSVFCTV